MNLYFVFPFHQLAPKPGQMSEDMGALVTETHSETVGREDDLAATRLTRDPWQALWSNLGFVTVMLTLGSLYVWRKDF